MATAGGFFQEDGQEMIYRLRENQGLHELEVFGCRSEKLESAQAWHNCSKSKNLHENFISVLKFSENNIPSKCFEKGDLVRYIKGMAKLTVRLRVGCVSDVRPNGYPLSGYKGAGIRHFGTGWIYRVTYRPGPCPINCELCSVKSLPATSWWEVEVFTACHVVYDKQEALHTSLDLFYDNDDDLSTVRTLSCHNVRDNDQGNDVCVLQCATHDVELGQSLQEAYQDFEYFKEESEEYWNPSLCVVISHPHGKPKKITVGEMVGKAEFDPENSQLTDFMYTYTTDTCNGSSGAPVLTSVGWNAAEVGVIWPGAGPHSWGHVDGKLNQCGAGAFYVEGDVTPSFTRGKSVSRKLRMT